MRLAASNIAWSASEDHEVLHLLALAGVHALEAAPARLFADPFGTPDATARRTADALRDRGFDLVAFQSLLFGADAVGLFESDARRARMADLLGRVVRLAGVMSVPVLVFGSPSARRKPDGMTQTEALDIATRFFSVIAAVAEDHGTTLCIEPNPVRYGCDFVTSSDEGAELVRAVGAPGFGLHLDAAGMSLSGEDIEVAAARHAPQLRHFHASAPDLLALEDEVVDHAAAARGLRAGGYTGCVSIEMRSGEPGTNADRVRSAVGLVAGRYDMALVGCAA